MQADFDSMSMSMSVDAAQSYETTIVERNQQVAVQFLVVPAKSAVDTYALRSPSNLAQYLELAPVEVVSFPTDSLLSGLFLRLLTESTDGVPSEQLQPFAEYLTSVRLIPFESSPLGLESALDILKTGSGMAMGAYAGLLAAAGSPPLFFILVPLGIILGGAAQGVAEALHRGIRSKILRSMGVSDRGFKP
jgi:hypothetical protein